jgi:hypothetical protein
VPAAIIRAAWKAPCLPVIPWTRTLVVSSISIFYSNKKEWNTDSTDWMDIYG